MRLINRILFYFRYFWHKIKQIFGFEEVFEEKYAEFETDIPYFQSKSDYEEYYQKQLRDLEQNPDKYKIYAVRVEYVSAYSGQFYNWTPEMIRQVIEPIEQRQNVIAKSPQEAILVATFLVECAERDLYKGRKKPLFLEREVVEVKDIDESVKVRKYGGLLDYY